MLFRSREAEFKQAERDLKPVSEDVRQKPIRDVRLGGADNMDVLSNEHLILKEKTLVEAVKELVEALESNRTGYTKRLGASFLEIDKSQVAPLTDEIKRKLEDKTIEIITKLNKAAKRKKNANPDTEKELRNNLREALYAVDLALKTQKDLVLKTLDLAIEMDSQPAIRALQSSITQQLKNKKNKHVIPIMKHRVEERKALAEKKGKQNATKALTALSQKLERIMKEDLARF